MWNRILIYFVFFCIIKRYTVFLKDIKEWGKIVPNIQVLFQQENLSAKKIQFIPAMAILHEIPFPYIKLQLNYANKYLYTSSFFNKF